MSGLGGGTLHTVVVGGGAVGSSIAYHLARRGMKKVLLLEASALGSGNTTQPPGFTSYTHPVTRYNRLMIASAKLYAQLAKEGKYSMGLQRPGTLRLGVSPQRLAEFDYYHAKDPSDLSRLLSKEELAHLFPFLKASGVEGALFCEGDGFVDTSSLSGALASAAAEFGAEVAEGVSCEGMRRVADDLWELSTPRGPVRAHNVVNAAGLAAKSLAALVGLRLPLVDITHRYALINPTPELPANSIPAIVDHEANWYIRPHGEGFLLGAFEDPDEVELAVEGGDEGGAVKESVKRARAAALAAVPALAEAGVAEEAAGRLSLSPDGLPLVGPVRGHNGYWVAAGFFDGVATAGGVGDYLAEWMLEEEPPYELSETCASRYDDWLTPKLEVERAKESYAMTLNWSVRPMDRKGGRPCSTRISGIYSALVSQGAHMYYRNGWEVAGWFRGEGESVDEALRREYKRVTEAVGIIDASYKGLIEVRGPDREDFLDHVLSFSPPNVGFMSEGLMLTPKGRIFSHCKLLHHEQNFLLVCSPEQESRNLRWLEGLVSNQGGHRWDVQLQKVSAYLSSVNVVGPSSPALLSSLSVANFADFPFKGARVLRIAGVPAVVVGFDESGERGFAVFVNRAETLKLYGALMQEAERLGGGNFGFKTTNILRMEAGLPRDGKELSLDFTPVEAGAMSMTQMDKSEFVGRRAVAEALAGEGGWELHHCRLGQDSPVPRGAEVIRRGSDGAVVGHVTSGAYSFALEAPIFFASIDSGLLGPGDAFSVDFGGDQRRPAEVLPQPPRPPFSG